MYTLTENIKYLLILQWPCTHFTLHVKCTFSKAAVFNLCECLHNQDNWNLWYAHKNGENNPSKQEINIMYQKHRK